MYRVRIVSNAEKSKASEHSEQPAMNIGLLSISTLRIVNSLLNSIVG